MKECNLGKQSINIIILIYLATTFLLLVFTPFTHSEANILFSNKITIETFIVKWLYQFSSSPMILRLPFYIVSIFSFYMYKKIVKYYFQKDSQFYNLAILFYLFTPGVFLSFIIINYATFPILLTLLFIYAYRNNATILQFIALILLIFTNTAHFAVYIAVALFAHKEKNWFTLAISIILLIISITLSNYNIKGVPSGHTLQLIGIYAVVFSPLLFLAMLYAIYRLAIDKKKDLLWYIVAITFTISMLLSIRQKIRVTDFTPFIVISIPLIIEVFRKSLIIRLKEFRKSYYIVCNIVFLVLLIETLSISLHYPLYLFNPNNRLIIDKSIYTIPNIANSIKNEGKECKNSISKKEKNLYRYYGIKQCP